MAHKPMWPEIWGASASSVDWFIHRTLNADSLGDDSWTRYLNDIESSAARKQRFGTSPDSGATEKLPEKAPWAQNIRRGVDEPFALKPESDAGSEVYSTTASKLNAALPPLPLRVEVKCKPAAGSRFVERFRDSHAIARSSKQYVAPFRDAAAQSIGLALPDTGMLMTWGTASVGGSGRTRRVRCSIQPTNSSGCATIERPVITLLRRSRCSCLPSTHPTYNAPDSSSG